MKSLIKHSSLFSFLILVFSCTSNDDANKDEEKPSISINYTEGFPKACMELAKGETYNFRAKVTDNISLAAYSIDIHHNFDHHTHDDQRAECKLDPMKTAINPLIFIENYTIRNATTSYEINAVITIPDDIDIGNYHCSYSVTDETGWQNRTSIDIKIIE